MTADLKSLIITTLDGIGISVTSFNEQSYPMGTSPSVDTVSLTVKVKDLPVTSVVAPATPTVTSTATPIK